MSEAKHGQITISEDQRLSNVHQSEGRCPWQPHGEAEGPEKRLNVGFGCLLVQIVHRDQGCFNVVHSLVGSCREELPVTLFDVFASVFHDRDPSRVFSEPVCLPVEDAGLRLPELSNIVQSNLQLSLINPPIEVGEDIPHLVNEILEGAGMSVACGRFVPLPEVLIRFEVREVGEEFRRGSQKLFESLFFILLKEKRHPTSQC